MENNKQFKAVSMDCNQEQFEQLRPYLEKIEGLKITGITDFERHTILVNNHGEVDKKISNVVLRRKDAGGRTYIGAFNPKAFIEACGGVWVEEKPSMKGKWFKYVDSSRGNQFTENKWYQCCKNSPLRPYAFIDNNGDENGYGDNSKYFDLSNPMDFNPDTAAIAAPQPETTQPETKFKEVPFNWETYLEYKDKGAYLEYCSKKVIDAHKFNATYTPYPIVILHNGALVSFTNDGKSYQIRGDTDLKLFIPTTTKTITVWAAMKDGEIISTVFTKDFAEEFQEQGYNVIELTKEIEL